MTWNDDLAYRRLISSCEEGRGYVYDAANYRGYASPRNLVLFAAGVELCEGDLDTGRALADGAIAAYGTSGLGDPGNPPACNLHRAIRSLLDQVHPDSVACPDGPQPPYRRGDGTDANGLPLVDNPLTPADESLPVSQATDTTGG